MCLDSSNKSIKDTLIVWQIPLLYIYAYTKLSSNSNANDRSLWVVHEHSRADTDVGQNVGLEDALVDSSYPGTCSTGCQTQSGAAVCSRWQILRNSGSLGAVFQCPIKE